VAIELVRDPEKPRLVLHGGKQWAVHKIPEPSTDAPTAAPAPSHAVGVPLFITAAPSLLQEGPPAPSEVKVFSEVKAIPVRKLTDTTAQAETEAPTITEAPTTTEATMKANFGFHQTQAPTTTEAPTVAAYPVKAEPEDDAEPGSLQWDLFSPGPSSTPDMREIDLLEVNVISFFAADLENPDKLEILISEGTEGHFGSHGRNVFDLEGGLYYNEKFLQKSYDDVTAVDLEKLQKSASESGMIGSGARNGAYLGEGLAVVSVGGMYTAATIMAVNVQTQALIGASLVGMVAGPIVGAVTGGLVGGAVSLAMIMGGYETVKGYTIQSASSKIFEKLRCMEAFKSCGDHVLVPKNKACPRH